MFLSFETAMFTLSRIVTFKRLLMKNVILGLLCCLVATGAAGQKKKGNTVAQEPVPVEYYKDGEAVYMEVEGERLYILTEEMPAFPTGDVQRWVARRVTYPVMAMERGISGTVYVQFVVETDGEGHGCEGEGGRGCAVAAGGGTGVHAVARVGAGKAQRGSGAGADDGTDSILVVRRNGGGCREECV